VRVRWAGTWKVAAVAVGLLIAVQALPVLMRPPQPPPLAKDVGLPPVMPAAEESPPPNLRFETDAERPKGTTGMAATGVISSTPRPRQRRERRQIVRPSPAPQPPVSATPPAEPVPYEPPTPPIAPPAPAPPPAPPGDGSEEFAPR